MAPKSAFLLKDLPPEILNATDTEPKGRTYDSSYSIRPGGIKITDLLLGMKLASVAVTDDKKKTLKNIAKQNPWHEKALIAITGSKEEAHRPLSQILRDHFNLDLDTHIDVSGIQKGRALDTQGYIAHNDDTIVLAYRCTTTALDWLTNLSITTSEWEPDIDIDLGHAGVCSCLSGRELCTNDDVPKKPRVHTGFYNNFIATAKILQDYVEPLLGDDQPPRKLYVVGHSLGAGIAQLAASYFLLNFDWEIIPQKLICVTAGAPRSCTRSFKEIVSRRLKELKPFDKVSFCRIVLNEDMVAKVPPRRLGFVHIDNLVYITSEGSLLIRPEYDSGVKNSVEDITEDLEEAQKNKISDWKILEENGVESEEKKSIKGDDYENLLKVVPRSLKDHMPDFYLKPLFRVFEEEHKKKIPERR